MVRIDQGIGTAEYLARHAYRTWRDWLPPRLRRKAPPFEKLTPEEKEAWREVALTIWQEVWTNARPPLLPSRAPRARSGKVSCFELLHDTHEK